MTFSEGDLLRSGPEVSGRPGHAQERKDSSRTVHGFSLPQVGEDQRALFSLRDDGYISYFVLSCLSLFLSQAMGQQPASSCIQNNGRSEMVTSPSPLVLAHLLFLFSLRLPFPIFHSLTPPLRRTGSWDGVGARRECLAFDLFCLHPPSCLLSLEIILTSDSCFARPWAWARSTHASFLGTVVCEVSLFSD